MGAKSQGKEQLPVNKAQYLTFFTAGEEYAISIAKVREIIEYDTVTTVPNTPPWISGVTNLRGKVIPVVDLAVKFGLQASRISKFSCIIITDVMFQGESLTMGVLSDAVSQVIDFSAEEIEQTPPFGTRVKNEYLLGLVLALFRHATAEGDPLAVEEHLVRLAVPLSGIRDPSAKLRGASPAVAKAKTRIDADPASPVTLSELAALSGMSRFQLVRAFARELGATPHAYLVQRRVRLARQLLLSGETPAIAAQGSGFADQSHMTRAFVRHFGITPARYVAARA